jgi:hypothetical protein
MIDIPDTTMCTFGGTNFIYEWLVNPVSYGNVPLYTLLPSTLVPYMNVNSGKLF